MNSEVSAPRKGGVRSSHVGKKANSHKRRFLGQKYQTKSRHFADVRKRRALREFHREQRRERRKAEKDDKAPVESEDRDKGTTVAEEECSPPYRTPSSLPGHMGGDQQKNKRGFSKRHLGPKKVVGMSMLSKAHDAQQRVIAARKKERDEREAERQQKAIAFAASQQQRKSQFRKLSSKTRHGQPVMARQIEHLLSKLKEDNH